MFCYFVYLIMIYTYNMDIIIFSLILIKSIFFWCAWSTEFFFFFYKLMGYNQTLSSLVLFRVYF